MVNMSAIKAICRSIESTESKPSALVPDELSVAPGEVLKRVLGNVCLTDTC